MTDPAQVDTMLEVHGIEPLDDPELPYGAHVYEIAGVRYTRLQLIAMPYHELRALGSLHHDWVCHWGDITESWSKGNARHERWWKTTIRAVQAAAGQART